MMSEDTFKIIQIWGDGWDTDERRQAVGTSGSLWELSVRDAGSFILLCLLLYLFNLSYI